MRWKSLKQRKLERVMAQSKWHTHKPWWPVTVEHERTGTHPAGTTIWLEHCARRIMGKTTYYAPLTVLLTDPYEVEQAELMEKMRAAAAQQVQQAVGIPNQILRPPGGIGVAGGVGVAIGAAPYFPGQQYGQLVGGGQVGLGQNLGGLANQQGNISHQQIQNDFLNSIYQAGGNGNGGSGS